MSRVRSVGTVNPLVEGFAATVASDCAAHLADHPRSERITVTCVANRSDPSVGRLPETAVLVD